MSRPSFMSDDEDEEDDVAHEAAIVASSLPSAFMLPSTLVASVMTPENPLFAGDTSPALASTPEKTLHRIIRRPSVTHLTDMESGNISEDTSSSDIEAEFAEGRAHKRMKGLAM